MPLEISDEDRATLMRLEENLWREETRFDMRFMERVLAPDFFEYGRSGRVYTREQSLACPRQPTDAALPLPNLKIRLINEVTAQVTYDSAITNDGIVEHGHRSSIWSRTPEGWILRFHQGTPYVP